MSIFGLAFSVSDRWLLGIVGALALLLLSVYVPTAIRRRQDSASAFRDAFNGVLLNLRENPDCPIAQIAFGFRNEHLAAIDRFRDHVPFWRISGFNRAVANYKEAYDIARDYGNVFAIALSEKTDVARAKRKHYHESIKLLLSYA